MVMPLLLHAWAALSAPAWPPPVLGSPSVMSTMILPAPLREDAVSIAFAFERPEFVLVDAAIWVIALRLDTTSDEVAVSARSSVALSENWTKPTLIASEESDRLGSMFAIKVFALAKSDERIEYDPSSTKTMSRNPPQTASIGHSLGTSHVPVAASPKVIPAKVITVIDSPAIGTDTLNFAQLTNCSPVESFVAMSKEAWIPAVVSGLSSSQCCVAVVVESGDGSPAPLNTAVGGTPIRPNGGISGQVLQ